MAQNKETIKRGEEKLALLNRRYGIEYLQDIDVAIQNISDSVSREEWYSELLAGIDIGEIKRGNQTEIYKFYEKNFAIFLFKTFRFCRRNLKSDYSFVSDLMQEMYLCLPECDFSTYKALSKALWRIMYRFVRIDAREKRYLRLDKVLCNRNHKMEAGDKTLLDIVVIAEKEEPKPSDDTIVARLIEWLKRNLSDIDFEYAYMRYILYSPLEYILETLGFSELMGEEFIERWDRRVMLQIRPKFSELCEYVGGVFYPFRNTIPSSMERMRDVMLRGFSFLLRPSAETVPACA